MKKILKPKLQKGIGLIEVLITLLLLSTSLLVIAAMQTRSLQFSHDAYLMSQANIHAYDILDRMRINISNLDEYESEMASVDPDAEPSDGNLSATDLDEWRRNIAVTLPSGGGGITCDATRTCIVEIQWYEIGSSHEDLHRVSEFKFEAKL